MQITLKQPLEEESNQFLNIASQHQSISGMLTYQKDQGREHLDAMQTNHKTRTLDRATNPQMRGLNDDKLM